MRDSGAPAIAVPPGVAALLEALWSNGQAAYVVGGSVRDALLGRIPADWDLATDARPDRILAIFPGSVYENRFGTVAVREDLGSSDASRVHEITTFRIDHEYADFRRPHRVEFGDRIEEDLARRDFTVNAMAWGAPAPAPRGHAAPAWLDPYDGVGDAGRRVLRAVGDPATRFEEDALRMVRAIRLAATLEFAIETATLRAIGACSDLVRHLSGERISAELDRLLAADRPSVGLRLLADTGLLAGISPELAAQPGIPQNKLPGEDLWDHTVRSVDAAPADRPVVRLAALLHDVGKPATLEDGPFRGHEVVGAELAAGLLARLRTPRAVTERVVHLVRQHMFTYDPDWGDAGVRRFIKRVGRGHLDDLFELRMADNIGSGLPPEAGRLAELRQRVRTELEAEAVLDRGGLAIHGDDLMRELGVPQGPTLGRLLDQLVERVIADPRQNDRATLLLLAAAMLADEPGDA
ncbi:MAG TPA: HD domain-containing protein [Candidatus Limnocylindrales bacterium]